MGERVVVEILDPATRRRIHAVMAGKDAGGRQPDYSHETVVKHLHSGGFLVRAPITGPVVYREDEVSVTPEVRS